MPLVARTRKSMRHRRAGSSSSLPPARPSCPTRWPGWSAGSTPTETSAQSAPSTRPSPHTATCSRIQGTPRSSDSGLAPTCWTSTRTGIARDSCSTCSGSAFRRAPVPDTVVAASSAAGLAGLAELRRVAIVPAYNEELAVPRVIDELRVFDPGLDIVVVDDGSVDRTAAVAAAKGARVLRLPFNLGIGGAVQTGFRFAFENDYDLAVRVDGDGQHDPSQLGRLITPVLA